MQRILVTGATGQIGSELIPALCQRYGAGSVVAAGHKREPEGALLDSGPHPIVPLMIRDGQKTTALVEYLLAHDILVTGLNYPVVPKGDEEIRFQISAGHTDADIDQVLNVLKDFGRRKDGE